MTDFVVADAGIRQLHARFTDAVWRQDAAEFSACFAKSGVWKIAGMRVEGRDKIAEACGMMLGRCERIHLIVGHPILEVGEGTALGRVSLTEFTLMKDGTTAMTTGWYHDHYVDEDGRWRFQHRHWSFKYRGPPDMTGFYPDTPDYGAFPAMPSPDEETFVRKA